MEYPAYMLSRPAVGTADYEVVLHQPDYWASATAGHPRGELIWTPASPSSNWWNCWRLWRNSGYATDGVDCRMLYGSYLFKCYAGTYFGLTKTDYTMPDGDWSGSESTGNYSTGYATIYSSSKRLQLAVPAGTKRLYALFGVTASTATCTMSLSAGGGTLNYTTFKLGSNCDGGSDIPSTAIAFESWVEIATDCGGQTLTITPDGANTMHVLGFIACTDTPSNPYDGVFDPATIINTTLTNQNAMHPLEYNLNGGSGTFWGLSGHTSAYKKLSAGYTHTMNYESSGASETWNPAARTLVRATTSQFCSRVSGTLTVDVSSTAEEAAAYAHVWSFSASGFDTWHDIVWNANAVTQGVRLVGTEHGGYCAQWGLANNFSNCRSIPDIGRTTIAPFNGGKRGESSGYTMLLEGGNLVAEFSAAGVILRADGSWIPSGDLMVIARAEEFPKFYKAWMAQSGDLAIVENDRMIGHGRRSFTFKYVL